jgi:hypothetical protein
VLNAARVCISTKPDRNKTEPITSAASRPRGYRFAVKNARTEFGNEGGAGGMHDDAASLVAVRHFLPQASELDRVGQDDQQKSTAWTGEACLVHWQVGVRVRRSGREREGPLYIRCVSGERGSARGSRDASVSDAWGRSGEGAKRGGEDATGSSAAGREERRAGDSTAETDAWRESGRGERTPTFGARLRSSLESCSQ